MIEISILILSYTIETRYEQKKQISDQIFRHSHCAHLRIARVGCTQSSLSGALQILDDRFGLWYAFDRFPIRAFE